MTRDNFVNLSLIALFVLVIIALVKCTNPTEPAAPAPFLGKWADDSRPPFLFMVEFRADHSVTFAVLDAGELISQTDGEWSHKPPLLITRDKACQEGPPLRLVPCQAAPDTVRPNISGDSWPLAFERDGEIISFQLRRVN
jgi:hypothetical protein